MITRRFVDLNPDGTVRSDRSSTATAEEWAKWDAANPVLPADVKDVTDHPQKSPLNGYRFKSQSGKDVVFDPPIVVIVPATESLEDKIERVLTAIAELRVIVEGK